MSGPMLSMEQSNPGGFLVVVSRHDPELPVEERVFFQDWSPWFLSESGPHVLVVEFPFHVSGQTVVACYLFFWKKEDYDEFRKLFRGKEPRHLRPALPWATFKNQVMFFGGTADEALDLLQEFDQDCECQEY